MLVKWDKNQCNGEDQTQIYEIESEHIWPKEWTSTLEQEDLKLHVGPLLPQHIVATYVKGLHSPKEKKLYETDFLKQKTKNSSIRKNITIITIFMFHAAV